MVKKGKEGPREGWGRVRDRDQRLDRDGGREEEIGRISREACGQAGMDGWADRGRE